MKRLLVVGIIMGSLFLVYRFAQDTKSPSDPQFFEDATPSPPVPIEPINSIVVDYENSSYSIVYTPLSNRTITLIPNYQTKTRAATVASENHCIAASSGGFYSTEDKPLGLLQINGELLSKQSDDTRLLTGFLFILENGLATIGRTYPTQAPSILQSGPYISSANRLQLRQDEPARRIVVIEDTNGQLYIAALISRENSYTGPFLADLPPILFSVTEPFRVRSALNLDGGSASFFMGEDGFVVSELVPVGSVICIR